MAAPQIVLFPSEVNGVPDLSPGRLPVPGPGHVVDVGEADVAAGEEHRL